MKRLLLSSAAALAMMTCAQAQTRTELNNQNNSTITTNGRGVISGSVMHSMIYNLIQSGALLNSDNQFGGNNTFNGPINLGISPQANGAGSIMGTPFSGVISPAPRSSATRADDTVNPLNYYAVCDGAQHPLSEVFGNNLAAAQAAFTVNGIRLVTLTSTSQDRDTVGFQAALNTAKTVWFPDNGRCWIRQQIIAPPFAANGKATIGAGFTGDGSGQFLANDIDFPSTTGAASTSPQGNMIQAAGASIASPINKPLINGFQFNWQGTNPESFVRPIMVINSTGTIVSNLNMFGFNNATYMIELDASANFTVRGNYLHDAVMSRSTNGQLSGIVVDDSEPNGAQPSDGTIIDNVIPNLTVSPAFKASFGYQTDGITIVHGKVFPTVEKGVTIQANTISNVGEPIDFQGNAGLVIGNNISYAHNGAIKGIHGATHVKFIGNKIYCPTIWGIAMFGASGNALGPTSDNYITDNTVWNMDCNGENLAHTSYAFGAAPDVSGQTFPASNNTFVNNHVDGAGPARQGGNMFAFFASGSGTGNQALLTYYSSDFSVPIQWSSPQTSTNFPITQNNGITLLSEVTGAASINNPAFTGAASFQGTTTFGSNVFNQATITGAPTSSSPTYACLGGDPDVGCKIVMKGAGALTVSNGDGILLQAVDPGGVGVNFAQIQAATTGNDVQINARGTDPVIPITLQGKGAAPTNLGNSTSWPLSKAPGYQVNALTTWADNQTCTAGQMTLDANFIYVCTATNTVKRVALSTF